MNVNPSDFEDDDIWCLLRYVAYLNWICHHFDRLTWKGCGLSPTNGCMHIKKCVARKTAMNSQLSDPTFKCQPVMLTCSSHWGLVGRTCWHAHHAIEPHQSGNDAKLANQIAEEIVGSCLNYNIWLIDSIIRKMLDLNLLPQEMLIKHSLTMPCRYQTNEGHCHCFSLWLWLYLSLCLVYGCNDSCRKPWPQNIHFEHAKNVHFTCIILP